MHSEIAKNAIVIAMNQCETRLSQDKLWSSHCENDWSDRVGARGNDIAVTLFTNHDAWPIRTFIHHIIA